MYNQRKYNMGFGVRDKIKCLVVFALASMLIFNIMGYFLGKIQSEYKLDMTCRRWLRSIESHNKVIPIPFTAPSANTEPHYDASTTEGNITPLANFVKYPCLPSLSKTTTFYKCVRMFNDTTTDLPSKLPCVPLKTLNGTTPICTYDPKNDVYVSKSLRTHGIWEGHLVYKLEAMLRDQPDLLFLDIGCNIGTYTTAMAHLGRTVVAVDALIDNLQLLNKSLVLGNLQKYVTLIWNAVSDTHTTLTFWTPGGNVGATRIVKNKTTNDPYFLVKTILLDDMIPLFKGKRVAMKMDVEGHEYNALKGGTQFFDLVEVSLIQMEWAFHYKTGRNIVNFLSTRGFKAFGDIEGKQSLEDGNISNWPPDIYFIKQRSDHNPFI